MPFTSFSENDTLPDGTHPPVSFAFDETRPLAFFAAVWTRWTSVRTVKEGETTNDIFAFLTTEPNKVAGAIHPKRCLAAAQPRQAGRLSSRGNFADQRSQLSNWIMPDILQTTSRQSAN
jgi:putative SOS response-associated peptidase YedK